MKKEKLTTFEKAKAIRRSLLIRVGETLTYKTWSNGYRLKNIQGIHKALQEWERKDVSFKIDPTDLSFKEMEELGFGTWSKGSKFKLIPIWLFPFLSDEFESESISGSKHFKLSEIDGDHRFGFIAYGVVPK